jgi:hypothetical protein
MTRSRRWASEKGSSAMARVRVGAGPLGPRRALSSTRGPTDGVP